MILQLFATAQKTNQNTTKSSHSTSGSSTVGGSHTESDTTSEKVGGSTSTTVGHSQTNSESAGGAHSESAGKSWASGKVEDQTQSQRDKYNTDYQENQKVQDTYNRLQATLEQKPQFQSQYESKLNELYDSILNRDKFNYNFNADPMYQMYKDKYTQQGKTAMEDTIGKANAMNGGYGSSYSQTAGQQTYQNYLNELNNMIPTLRNQAYTEYEAEGNRMLQNYQLTNDAYNREYGQYRDDVSDWQADRNFNQSAYQDERNFDYNQFANERNYWNQEYWNEKNAEQSNTASSDQSNWNKAQSTTDSISQTDSKYWENAHSHTTTDSSNWSNTSSWSDTNSTQNIEYLFNNAASSGSKTGSKKANDTTVVDDTFGGNTGNTYYPYYLQTNVKDSIYTDNSDWMDKYKVNANSTNTNTDRGYSNSMSGYGNTGYGQNYTLSNGSSNKDTIEMAQLYNTKSDMEKAKYLVQLKEALGLSDEDIEKIKTAAKYY